jgi:hypothetical protein
VIKSIVVCCFAVAASLFYAEPSAAQAVDSRSTLLSISPTLGTGFLTRRGGKGGFNVGGGIELVKQGWGQGVTIDHLAFNVVSDPLDVPKIRTVSSTSAMYWMRRYPPNNERLPFFGAGAGFWSSNEDDPTFLLGITGGGDIPADALSRAGLALRIEGSVTLALRRTLIITIKLGPTLKAKL